MDNDAGAIDDALKLFKLFRGAPPENGRCKKVCILRLARFQLFPHQRNLLADYIDDGASAEGGYKYGNLFILEKRFNLGDALKNILVVHSHHNYAEGAGIEPATAINCSQRF